MATVGTGRSAGAQPGTLPVGMEPLDRALVPSLATALAKAAAAADASAGVAVAMGVGLTTSFFKSIAYIPKATHVSGALDAFPAT